MKSLPRSSGDAGAPDPRLAAALASGDRTAALTALVAARVLVPMRARVVARGLDGADKESDTELALLTAPDGGLWLPAFTGNDAFASWSRTHRPVRGSGAAVAGEAVERGLAGLLLDVAGPVRLQVEGPALAALAAGRAPGAVTETLPLRMRPGSGAVPALGVEAYRVEVSTDGGASWAPALGVVPVPGSSLAALAASAVAAGWTGDLLPLAGALLAQARAAAASP